MLYFRIHLRSRNFHFGFRNLEPLVCSELELGLYRNRGAERELLVVHVAQIDLRIVYGKDPRLLVQDLAVSASEAALESVVEKYAFAVHTFYDASGSVSLAESRNVILSARCEICLRKSLFPFVCGKRKIDFDRAFLLFYTVVHICPPKDYTI